ncbi:MAG: hypothetical protein RBU29_08445 [bacterium]|nr:hypothetical protein [bacterium]
MEPTLETELLETPEDQPVEPSPKAHRSRRIKWATYTVDEENPPVLHPFDLAPVSDIPIRLAVEQGYLKNKRDLALFQLKDEWNGHPVRSIVIAGKLEAGREFAVWIADDKEHRIDRKALARKLAGDEFEGQPSEAAQSTQTPGEMLDWCSIAPPCHRPVLVAKIHIKHKPRIKVHPDHQIHFYPKNKIYLRFKPRIHLTHRRESPPTEQGRTRGSAQ